MSKHTTYMPRRRGGFTLIELLVVVAIIALLISILLPSLNAARRNARAVTCGTNLRHVGTSVALYLADNASIFPASYIYANGPGGKYDLNDQPLDKRYGYLHWSYFLYQDGKVSDKAFTCPEFRLGGVPRTNPGSEGAHWEAAQVDDTGGGSPGSRQDFQAPFMAFTANAAIMPRNKFTPQLSGGLRVNRLVNETKVKSSRAVILATEFHNNWKTAAVPVGSNALLSKGHRPINPFYHVAYGTDEYGVPTNNSDFIYGTPSDRKTFGLLKYNAVKDAVGLIDERNIPETNSVGRHHPGGDELGGTTNFLYVDGSVQRKTILQTLRQREWGDAYYALSGANTVQYGN